MFINLLTGGNGGGGSTTAGVNSLNGQKGDLKLKTVNNNDLLGEGNIEIQAGVTSVNGQEGAVVIDVPTKVSQLENDANYAAQSEIPTTTSELTNNSGYITIADVPTKVSQLQNDANFQTQEQVTTSINEAISGFTEGMEKVYMAQLDEAGRKDFFDYVSNNLDANYVYNGSKWPFMIMGRGSACATQLFKILETQICAIYTDFRAGTYTLEKIVKQGKEYKYVITNPSALVSNVTAGTIYIREQETKPLALDATDVNVDDDVIIPFTKINNLFDAIVKGYNCCISLSKTDALLGRKVTIPATIYSDGAGDSCRIIFAKEGKQYQYTLTEAKKMTFEEVSSLPNINSSEVSNIKVLTQAEYDAIDPKDEKTLYMIKG